MHQFFTQKAIKAFTSGATITLATIVMPVGMAIAIEGAANRTLYRFFPHLYKDVKYAYGIPHLMNNNTITSSSTEPERILSSASEIMSENSEEEINGMDTTKFSTLVSHSSSSFLASSSFE